MVGGTSILARKKPDRFRNQGLDDYVFERWRSGWLRLGYEKASSTIWMITLWAHGRLVESALITFWRNHLFGWSNPRLGD